MPKLALLANLRAKPGKGAEVAQYLAEALPWRWARTSAEVPRPAS